MITYSIIEKSQLEGANRLDAEYYQPEYLDALKKLSKSSTVAELASDIRYGLYIEPDYLEEGIKFIRAMNLFETDIEGEILKINPIKVPSEYKLKVGDCLITRSGANTGTTSVVYPKLQDATFGSYTIRMRFNKINPFFVGLFLNTKYGIFQTLRLQTGMAQPNLNIPNIEEIKIPIFSESEQKRIELLCLEIQNQKETSSKIYQQAEKLLLEELGMGEYQFDSQLFNVVNFLEVKTAERMDAEYFQPKYAKLEKKIRENNAQRLGDLVTVKKGFEPGSEEYLEEGKLFIRVSSLTKLGIIDKDQKYLSKNLYKELKKDYEPKVGEILLTKDASPGIAYVVKEPVEGIISGGIVRLKLKEQGIEPEYLALCISSLVGQSQAQRDAGGSVIMHWKPDQIKNLFVPILPQSIQKKISDLVIQSHEARKKARELLEEAKLKVEQLIEKGGE